MGWTGDSAEEELLLVVLVAVDVAVSEDVERE